MKKLLATFVSLVLVFGLASCSGTASNSVDPGYPTSTGAPEEPGTDGGGAAVGVGARQRHRTGTGLRQPEGATDRPRQPKAAAARSASCLVSASTRISMRSRSSAAITTPAV